MNQVKYNNNLFSIKLETSDLRITDQLFDQLFTSINRQTNFTYFFGFRPDCDQYKLDIEVKIFKERTIWSFDEFYRVCIKLNSESFDHSRSQIDNLWKLYQYPAMIFAYDDNDELLLINYLKNEYSFQLIATKLQGLIIIYKGIEEDVIWVAHSSEFFENGF